MAFFSLLASLSILGIVLFYRSYEVRVGRFDKAELAERELLVTHEHIESLNNKALQALRHGAALSLIMLVKGTIRVLYFIKRESSRLSTKLDHFFLSDGIRTKGSVSFFLRDVAAYKEAARSRTEIGRAHV